MYHDNTGTPSSNKADRHQDTITDLPLLDTIAVCLTTGKPWDVVAATISGDCLILSKSGNISDEDEAAVGLFFSEVKRQGRGCIIGSLSQGSNWTIALPFLFSHSKANANKRLSRVHRAITDLFDDLCAKVTSYSETSILDEFHDAMSWIKHPHQGETVGSILMRAIRTCRELSLMRVQPDTVSQSKFLEVIAFASILSKSRFLSEITADWILSERTKTLKGRLDKLCQYTRVDWVISKLQQIPDLRFRWTPSSELWITPFSPEQIQLLKLRVPNLLDIWVEYKYFKPRLHAELRLILHLYSTLPITSGQFPIGCSKRSCFCCTVWIGVFNEANKSSWMTSGSHGKPYPNCAFPGNVDLKLNELVLQQITVRLADTLRSLMPMKTRRLSDEQVSSSESEDAVDPVRDQLDSFSPS
ncbi:hypothetical protein M422DRAFT_255833 [Sphaerobolus stellatus SS14]|uniref:Uncharacterized protein n=1 Tax=Sphaerobolus stellatus (strain SS14) TaxID=990650 RepID=A0A0C9V2V7_SPHS4|nr:hypothetical protein M422DRAFT_255833 [Sphaerobolus stellatus SS14]